MQFKVRLEESEEEGYTAQCLELPAAISEGNTREEALENIKEAIQACSGSDKRTGPGAGRSGHSGGFGWLSCLQFPEKSS